MPTIGFEILKLGGVRAVNDPIMILFFLFPFVISFSMSYVYQYIQPSLKGTELMKGIKFGFLIWLVSSIPSAFIVFTSMNYPIGFTIDSVVGTLIYMLAAGIAIVRLMK